MHLLMYPYTNLPINLSIHPPTKLSVCLLFMYLPINSSIHPPMHYPPTYPLNHPTSVCQPVCLSVYLPTFHSFMHPLTDSPIPVSTIFQLFNHLPTHLCIPLFVCFSLLLCPQMHPFIHYLPVPHHAGLLPPSPSVFILSFPLHSVHLPCPKHRNTRNRHDPFLSLLIGSVLPARSINYKF